MHLGKKVKEVAKYITFIPGHINSNHSTNFIDQSFYPHLEVLGEVGYNKKRETHFTIRPFNCHISFLIILTDYEPNKQITKLNIIFK